MHAAAAVMGMTNVY
jgi:alkyl hydroperoxide reductase subunit D